MLFDLCGGVFILWGGGGGARNAAECLGDRKAICPNVHNVSRQSRFGRVCHVLTKTIIPVEFAETITHNSQICPKRQNCNTYWLAHLKLPQYRNPGFVPPTNAEMDRHMFLSKLLPGNTLPSGSVPSGQAGCRRPRRMDCFHLGGALFDLPTHALRLRPSENARLTLATI